MNYKEYLTDPKCANSIRLGVGLLIFRSNKLLLERRSDCNKWGLIGGGVEIGEKVEDAAIRECFEETALRLNIENLKFFGLYSDINDFRVIKYPDSCFHAIDLIYSYELKENNVNIKKSEESFEISFFSLNNIPQNIVPPAKSPINHFLQRKLKF